MKQMGYIIEENLRDESLKDKFWMLIESKLTNY